MKAKTTVVPAKIMRRPNYHLSSMETAVVTPDRKQESTSAERWVQASCMLQDNPTLMTPRVLLAALKQQPPVHIIRFMLAVNPQAASVPSEGPTPLQIAVQNSASIPVVEALIEACPFALCVTNPGHAVDPLSYAKKHRKEETDLIALLSRPLDYWVSERHRDPNASMTRHHGTTASSNSKKDVRQQMTSDRIDRDEINNVKLLCAQVLKGHKKLSRQLTACQKIQEQMAQKERPDILQDVKDAQQHQFQRQLIALDMKERAFRAHVKRANQRAQIRCDTKLATWTQEMESWRTTAETNRKEWKTAVEQEARVNLEFRKEVAGWMEEATREPSGKRGTPIVFATNLGEVNDTTPLYPRAEPPSEHIRGRPSWNPLFRNCHLMLQDDDEC